MAELVIDDEIKRKFLEQANIAGLNPSQFLNSLLQIFITNKNDDCKFNEETKRAIRQGRADFDAGKLKSYTDWREMIKDIEVGKDD